MATTRKGTSQLWVTWWGPKTPFALRALKPPVARYSFFLAVWFLKVRNSGQYQFLEFLVAWLHLCSLIS